MLPQRDENVVLSTRNIPSTKVQHVSSINVVELLKHDYVIMPVKTVRWIEMVFGEGLSAEEASRRIAEEADEVSTQTLDVTSEETTDVTNTEAEPSSDSTTNAIDADEEE